MPYRMVQARDSAAPALAARGVVAAALAEVLRSLPPRPLLLDACVVHLGHTGMHHEYDGPALRGFLKLRDALLGSAGPDPELKTLWREAVATGHYAAHMAAELGLDARIAAAAGLMHRVGEALVLAALARIEDQHDLRLDSAARAGVCAEYGAQQAARVLAAWRFSAPVAVAVVSWRGAPSRGGQHTEATAVYVGHLLATRQKEPEFAMLGLNDAVTGDLGIAQDALDRVLSSDVILRGLLERVG